MVTLRNSCELNAMKSANTASVFHAGSSAISDFHTHFLSGSITWCWFKVNNTNTYKSGPGLPIRIIKVVKLIYQEFRSKNVIKHMYLRSNPE